ncbi:serine/threonine-protein kinase [Streptomyces sp. CRN 30]|uniref:serine/threonine-protein kinase n=1 Tax=Streptomyces sp. CRN 30 TaxID=3075613 RepID=UPI002A835B0B|nr:serine/threonine-protein kinase [Streptomyces sp. CRN 30]
MVVGSDGPGDRRGATQAGYATGGGGRSVADRYELIEQLGRGGMGTVWRAHDRVLERDVAAKELHVLTDGDEEHRTWLRRALREARVAARVPHPHVVGVHDLVDHEGRLWIVMELVEGPSLAQSIERDGPWDAARVATLGVQLLGALDAVHAVGALHRDVKPPNVLLRRDGGAVLTDFGIAALDDGEFLTQPGEVAGSADYMAPERVTGGDVGPASDLFSLGATLATAATGQSPFRRNGQAATLHAVAYEEAVLDDRLGPLRPVVEALLRKAPEQRPSVADALAALQRVAGGAEVPYALPAASAAESSELSVSVGEPQPTVPSGALADAPTQVGHPLQQQGQAGATQLYDADALSAVARQEGEPNRSGGGGSRLWWAVAAGVAVLAGMGAGLFLTGSPPFGGGAAQAQEREQAEGAGAGAAPSAGGAGVPDAPVAPVTTELTVQAREGWQQVTEAPIGKGDTVTVRFLRGQWTVDAASMPSAGPGGYDAATDSALDFAAESCKVNRSAPFAALVGHLLREGQTENPDARVVGDEWTFQAPADGTLELRINDGDDDCLSDNEGELTVSVTVTH